MKEAEIAVSHPHLLAEVEIKAMSETRLFFFLKLELWTLCPGQSLGDFYSRSLSSRLVHLAWLCRSLQNVFSAQMHFPEPTEVHFLRRCSPREWSMTAEILQEWTEGMLAANVSFFSARLTLPS